MERILTKNAIKLSIIQLAVARIHAVLISIIIHVQVDTYTDVNTDTNTNANINKDKIHI